MRLLRWILLGVLVCGVGALEAYRGSPLSPYVNGQLILCAVLAIALSRPEERTGWGRWDGKMGLGGIAALLGISLLYIGATNIIYRVLFPMTPTSWDFFAYYTPIYHETIARLGRVATHILYFGMLLIIAPVGEELFYRGLLAAKLRAFGKFPAAFWSSLLFGLRHAAQLTYFWPSYPLWVGVNYAIFTFAMGLYLTGLFEKKGMGACIIAHLGLNLVLGPLGILFFNG